jgi:hypothetical protein
MLQRSAQARLLIRKDVHSLTKSAYWERNNVNASDGWYKGILLYLSDKIRSLHPTNFFCTLPTSTVPNSCVTKHQLARELLMNFEVNPNYMREGAVRFPISLQSFKSLYPSATAESSQIASISFHSMVTPICLRCTCENRWSVLHSLKFTIA